MTRLKELLFDAENQRLSDLQQHLDMLAESDARRYAGVVQQIADIAEAAKRQAADLDARLTGLSESEARERLEVLRRIEQLFEGVGTKERFTARVAETIDGALRQAEVDRHQETAAALAPLVVRTVKAEIRNSQDELVEALYPMTGRMVKAYVASAIKDLTEQINRRLEQNALMLRLRSITTGRSVAELALAGAQPLKVEEIYLIRRGSGDLVGRWPQSRTGSNRDLALSGTLTAINEFATEAFKSEGSSLRHIDLDTAQVYLRASPLYLLAAKCHGAAPQAVEQIFDEEFLAVLESTRASEPANAARGIAQEPLDRLAAELETRVAQKQKELAVPPLPFSPLRAAALLVALPLLAWLGWHLYSEYETGLARDAAERVVSETAELRGYPMRIDVEARGALVTANGLAPTADVRSLLIDRLRAALPTAQVRDRLGVVPSNLTEAEAMVAKVRSELSGVEQSARQRVMSLETAALKNGLLRALDSTHRRLARGGEDLARLEADSSGAGKAGIAELRASIERTGREVDELRASLASDGIGGTSIETASGAIEGLERQVERAVESVMTLAGGQPSASAGRIDAKAGAASPLHHAEALATSAERLAATAVAALQASAVRRALPVQTPREHLKAWTREHAIFFGANTDYRDLQSAEQRLDELASLMRQSGALVRIVGYTDERGGQLRNQPLSQARAEKVQQDLAARGVPRQQLVAMGRVNAADISPSVGPASPNRRVEFEVGFVGEEPQ